MALAEYLPGLGCQQQWKQIGEIAQGYKQDVGAPGTDWAGSVLHLGDIAVVAPAAVTLVVTEKCHPKDQAKRAERKQCPFLEAVVQLLTPNGRLRWRSRAVLQNALFPAPGAALTNV